MSQPQPPPPTSFPRFFNLPPELRNTIYDIILPTDQTIIVTSADSSMDTLAHNLRIAPLQICSRMRGETAAMFYGANSFQLLLDGTHSLKWLYSLGNNVCLLKAVVLVVTVDKQLVCDVVEKVRADRRERRAVGPTMPIRRAQEGLFRHRADGDADAAVTVLEGLRATGLEKKAVEIEAGPSSFALTGSSDAYKERMVARLRGWASW